MRRNGSPALVCLVAIGLFLFVGKAFAQQEPPPSLHVAYELDSGWYENSGTAPVVVLSFPVVIEKAQWLRLYFDEVTLSGSPHAGTGSILRMTALADGAIQEMDARHIGQWRKSSAYFNGNTVLVEILAQPGTGWNRVAMRGVDVGLKYRSGDSICGPTDDRGLSYDARVGRLLPGGCTGFIIDDCKKCMLTAGHCAGSNNLVEFNVPLSNPDGSLNHPSPDDQYAIDAVSMQSSDGGIGDDWAYYGCYPNPNTGLTPGEAQGEAFVLAPPPFPSGENIRVTGYGGDDSPLTWNQVQQTHIGPMVSGSPSVVQYQTDTRGGSSGSPVVREQTGKAIGIHTDGGCDVGGGHNSGTSSTQAGLEAALAAPTGVCAVETKLTAMDAAAYDSLGSSVSMSNGLALIGALGDDDNGTDSGSAYIFDPVSGQQLLKIIAQDGQAHDGFGEAVSLSDGLALIGAFMDSDNGLWSGSAYILDAGTGQQLFKLKASDGYVADMFGRGVSISGGLAIVGAAFDDDNGTDSGSAYLFDTASGQQLRKLTAQDGANGDHFGLHVSLSGGLAVLGAYADDDNGLDSGAAYVFDAATGQQLLKLTPQDGAAGDCFGYGVSASKGRVLIGAHCDDDNGADSGSAYVFDISTGQQLLKLTAQDGKADDRFGYSVSLSGGRALVGAINDDDKALDSGSAYVFDAVTGQQLHKIITSDGWIGDAFGHSVSLSNDRVLVGAPYNNDTDYSTGAAYSFDVLDKGPGNGFCFGNPGSGIPCPCNNDNDGSIPGSGCANGAFTSGAQLVGSGTASVSGDSVVLKASRMEPNNSGLFFQANNDLSPGITWGDGLRCAGGNLIRLQVRFADGDGSSTTDVVISAKAGNISPGDTKYYQCWYRDPLNSPCGYQFNATNGYSITWMP